MSKLTDDELRSRSSELAAKYPAGSKWRHYRRGVYEIVAACLYKDGAEPMIAYRGENGVTWVQLERKFSETVIKDSKRVPRFVRVMERLTEASNGT